MDTALPERLLRFYDDKKYADAFLDPGTIRLRPLSFFKTIEDETRADDSEGQAKLKVQGQELTAVALPGGKVSSKLGELDWGVVSGNPMFIFCTSLPTVDVKVIGAKWPFTLEIHDPKLFKKDLEDAAAACAPEGATLIGVDCVSVEYDKGRSVLEMPDFGKCADLAYTQKPPLFSSECEFRFVAIYDVIEFPEDTKFIDLKLKSPKAYARVLEV